MTTFQRILIGCVFFGLAGVLFAQYSKNYFRCAYATNFRVDTKGKCPTAMREEALSESFVVGRINANRWKGPFLSAGLLTRNSDVNHPRDNPQDYIWTQFAQYINDYIPPGNEFTSAPYGGQSGLQGHVLSLIDYCGRAFNFSSHTRMRMLRSSCILLLLVSILYYVFWAYRELGFVSAAAVFFCALLAERLTVYSDNFYWLVCLQFLPMTWILWRLETASRKKTFKLTGILIGVFFLFLLKCLCGYECFTVVVIASFTPVVYYSFKDNWGLKKTLVYLFSIGLCSVFAFAIAISINAAQLHYSDGRNFMTAVSALMSRGVDRAGMAPLGYKLPFEECMLRLWTFRLFVFPFRINICHALLPVIIITVLCSRFSVYDDAVKAKIKPLLYTTWFSFLAPLSWGMLMSQHTAIHIPYIAYIWHLPTMLFIWMLVGKAISTFFRIPAYAEKEEGKEPGEEKIKIFTRLWHVYNTKEKIVLALVFCILVGGAVYYRTAPQMYCVAENFSDFQWTKGVNKNGHAFFVRNTWKNRLVPLEKGTVLYFLNRQKYTVKSVVVSGKYINVYVDGAVPLDPDMCGYPRFIQVISAPSKNTPSDMPQTRKEK